MDEVHGVQDALPPSFQGPERIFVHLFGVRMVFLVIGIVAPRPSFLAVGNWAQEATGPEDSVGERVEY